MHCLQNNIQTSVHYIQDMAGLKRYLKNNERVIFFDYGSNINAECIPTMCSPLPKGYQVMVFPAVKEGVNWALFKKKTLEGSKEPTEQRGLTFDTKVDKQLGEFLWSVEKTEPQVWCLDVKPVDKILKGTVIPMDSTMFNVMKLSGVKICACTAARCTQTFIHKCVANILETSGITVK